MKIFDNILSVDIPVVVEIQPTTGRNAGFVVRLRADGKMPFSQVILRRDGAQLAVIRAMEVADSVHEYVAQVPEGLFGAGPLQIQAEGCRQPDISRAGGADWIKSFHTLDVGTAAKASTPVVPQVVVSDGMSHPIRVHFAIHKHMHQPYYRTDEEGYWDGTIDGIFATRKGPYADYLLDAVERYVRGGLPHAGLSASFSGSLIEQLDRCDREGLCGGAFRGWRNRLGTAGALCTAFGHPRIDFVAFGFFHPLMPLIPDRDIVRQIEWHRAGIREAFGVDASPVLFPPETAFHVRMIPALLEAGVEAVIYDSIHRFRACKEYPYAGTSEGMLPPNLADQRNPTVNDWMQLHNVWAGSKISPSLLRPAYIRYVDAADREHRIIGVPAERYLGNEDARGGFGALQYPSVLGQLYDRIVETGTYDPQHPPFFVLHSDGDNFGGGADSYYRHNTERLVEWLQQDTRFELTTIRDYLQRFPLDPREVIHVEPGSWSGADNGDPQFMKWFSMWDADYSPDLNSWAVLTALQNLVHSAEDVLSDTDSVRQCQRLLLMAETSCYWYWTGQTVWDTQVTSAANRATSLLSATRDRIRQLDRLGPTIFPPWLSPTNPGGKAWGSGGLVDAPRQATLHTLIHDVNALRSATIVLRTERGEQRVPLLDRGPYPCRTSALQTAQHFSAQLPVGLGLVRYFVEATDGKGNLSQSSLDHVYLP